MSMMNERKALSLGGAHGEKSPWDNLLRNGSLGSIKKDPEYSKAKPDEAAAALDLAIKNHRMDAAGSSTDERREATLGVEAHDAAREAEAKRLVESAVSEKREQQAMVEASPLERTWQESLAFYVQLKHDQVARLEDRLERLLANRQRDLKQNNDRKPSFFVLPKTRRAWQDVQLKKRARIQSLVNRLGVVRDIRSGMGVFAPRIEELATRKMRAAHPEMASDWDAMREAFRIKQTQMRLRIQREKWSEVRKGKAHRVRMTIGRNDGKTGNER